MYMGYDHSSPGIEDQGQKLEVKVKVKVLWSKINVVGLTSILNR